MLAVIRALNEGRVETPGTITFVADVGEEGLGDLRGMKSLFFDSLKGQIDKFVSVDGTGLGIAHIGVGSNRYKVTFKGPGGHSYGAFGMANPIQAMGRAIAKIDALEVPRSPRPRSTWDASAAAPASTPSRLRPGWKWICGRPTRPRSRIWTHASTPRSRRQWPRRTPAGTIAAPVSASAELVGVRPAGQTAKDSPIVQTALAVSRAMQIEEVLREGSTDSNVPMNLEDPGHHHQRRRSRAPERTR